MPILQIADKPTLDTVDFDVTYIKNNLPSGGSSPILVIKNDDMDFTDIEFTISCGDFTNTVTMPDDDNIEIEVPYIGEYSISYSDDLSITDTVNILNVGKTLFIPSLISIPSFANATWEQIEQIVTAYYNGIISDLSQYWSVGDTKSVDLSAMPATGVSESHNAQTVQMTILDFEHDDLVTPINGHTKAAITLQQVGMLVNRGYMNSTDTNANGWNGSARRIWCNNIYYNALPSAFKSMIKQKQTKASAGSRSSTITTSNDYCFLVSEIEVFGTTSYSFAGEGTQYPYYTVASRRIKKTNYGSTYDWWDRSPRSGDSLSFCFVSSSGSTFSYGASSACGFAPACCL